MNKMIQRLSLSAAVVLITLSISSLVFANETAALAKGEVVVNTIEVPNASIPKMIVKGVVDEKPEKVWEVVSNCSLYEQRMPRIKESRLVREENGNIYCSVTVGLPFPLSDLTAITRARHTIGPPLWKRAWTLVEGNYSVNTGSWEIETFNGDRNRSLVTYTILAEPTTAIPGWAQRRAQQSSLPDLIRAVREQAAKLP